MRPPIPTRLLPAALAVTFAGLVLAACGDDDTAGIVPLDQAGFIAAADAVCERLDREGTALAEQYHGEDFSREPSADEQAEFFRQLIPRVEAGMAEIRALEGPDEGEALRDLLIAGDPFIPGAKRALELYDAGDHQAFERAVQELFTADESETVAELNAEAKQYGFSACTEDGDNDGDYDGEE